MNRVLPSSNGFSWWGLGLVLAMVTTINFVAMPREENFGDPLAVRCESVTLLNEGRLGVPSELALTFGGGERGQYFFQRPDGRWFSKYGLLNTLIYAIPLGVEKWRHGKLENFSPDRVTFLNALNLVLAALSAGYLYLFTVRYTRRLAVQVLYVLAAFYATFWWFHLRVQGHDVIQTLLLMAAVYHFTQAFASAGREDMRQLFFSALAMGLLILSKPSYVLVYPLLAALLVWRTQVCGGREGSETRISWKPEWRSYARYFAWLVAPSAVFVGILLALNVHKFGNAFETGYSQWERQKNYLDGDIYTGIFGFLLNPQFSIFIYFPVLVIALFGVRRFLARHRFDGGVFLGVALLLLFMNSKFINWPGHWSYGPRYMLPVLGILSLPAVIVGDSLWDRRKTLGGIAGMTLVFLLLFGSLRLQWNVITLPFYSFYDLNLFFGQFKDPRIAPYFSNSHYGLICGDLLAFKAGKPYWLADIVNATADPTLIRQASEEFWRDTRSNFFWFPDPTPETPASR